VIILTTKSITSGYLLRPCKSTAAFEALPDIKGKNFDLDLTKCTELLVGMGYNLVCDAKVMVLVKREIEVTIFPSGKMVLKTDSKSNADDVMKEIYNKILD
jgi:hypothetical protein